MVCKIYNPRRITPALRGSIRGYGYERDLTSDYMRGTASYAANVVTPAQDALLEAWERMAFGGASVEPGRRRQLHSLALVRGLIDRAMLARS